MHIWRTVLQIVILTVTGSVSFSSVKEKLHTAATLPCNRTCSGLVAWILSKTPHDLVAQCNHTSCQSKQGFHMSHDQYLKGDLSLTISAADYSKRAWYTCTCNNTRICDVSLRIEAPEFLWHRTPGESLTLDVPVSESVEVIFLRSNGASADPLCGAIGRELQCKPEYKKRVSFSSSLQLKDLKESDSGVYAIWDTKNKETVSSFTVTVEGNTTDPNKTLAPEKVAEERWIQRNYQGLLIGLVGGLALCLLVQRCREKLDKQAQCFSRGLCAREETCDPPDPEDGSKSASVEIRGAFPDNERS